MAKKAKIPRMDGKSVSPLNELAELLKTQFPHIFAEGKVNPDYINPPYNTGSDSFIYPDRFKEEKDDYELRAGIKDEEGLLVKCHNDGNGWVNFYQNIDN